jgi:hypothetical protein
MYPPNAYANEHWPRNRVGNSPPVQDNADMLGEGRQTDRRANNTIHPTGDSERILHGPSLVAGG